MVLQFYYLIDLHYSQTHYTYTSTPLSFYYLIDLHYSQTSLNASVQAFTFYYLIDLHYSQTLSGVYGGVIEVLLPYRFTLFSNIHIKISAEHTVLLPYRFTLFSNGGGIAIYGGLGFTTLQIYTILKHRLYTLSIPFVLLPYRFTLFSNSTTQ